MSTLPFAKVEEDAYSPAVHVVELQNANQKLDAFAHIASHDLRSPLRAMMSLVDWIRDDLETTLGTIPETIAADLDEVSAQGRRMGKLLKDLMDYSQIGHERESYESFDPKPLVAESVLLCAVPPDFTVTLAAEYPAIICSPVEFSLVIRNFLSNAIKHHDRTDGHIDISATQKNGFAHFRIRDDGPGIPPQYASQIFEMFRTLDSNRGNGIGLGLVKRIADQIGGIAIYKPNTDGRGSDFSASFPLAETQRHHGVDPKQRQTFPDISK